MKKIISFTLAVLMFLLCSCSGEIAREADLPPNASPKKVQSNSFLENLSAGSAEGRELNGDFSEAMGNSAFDYFSKTVEQRETDNILISPLSIYIALAMTACGAEGDTLSQIQSVLGGLPIDDAAGYIYTLCEDIGENEEIYLGLANSVWVREDGKNMIDVNEKFLDVAKEYFSADVFKESFDGKTLENINKWIEENTDGMIDKMLDEISDSTVMYLINALVFEADWQETYDESQVREAEFTSYSGTKKLTELMFSEENYYLSGDGAEGFIKPYKDDRYAFAALLPENGTDVYEYAMSLDGEKFSDILSSKERAIVETAMPQFSYEYSDSLANELKALGMTYAFDSLRADLSGLGSSPDGNLFVSDVLHKTFIEVSPKGTKAGAATVVAIDCESALEIQDVGRYVVYLDRPFVYTIVDLESGIPLFVGVFAELE